MTRVFTYISSYTTCGDHVDALPEGDRPDEGNVCNTADSVGTQAAGRADGPVFSAAAPN